MLCALICIIYREREDNHEIEKTFLKRFDVSLLQLSFCCSNTHLEYF